MATGMGHANVVPRKLEKGMKVVVMFKPGTYMLWHEIEAGIKPGVWFKAELVGLLVNATSDTCAYPIEYNGITSYVSGCTAIIIRSVSREDNPKPWEQRNLIKVKARRQLARLAKSVKIVRIEIK